MLEDGTRPGKVSKLQSEPKQQPKEMMVMRA